MPSLADIVVAEAALVSGFVRLLEEEQALLKHGDAEALPDVVERKTAKARELAAASGEPTQSERHGYGQNEFVPWQIGAVM